MNKVRVAAIMAVGAIGIAAVAMAGQRQGASYVPVEPKAASWQEREFYERFEEEVEYPEDFFLFERTAGNSPSPEALLAAGDQARTVARLTRAVAPRLAGARWRFVGPSNIGGRVVDVAVDPKLKDTIYVASASGGVWKSTDAGETYRSIWPKRLPQSMGALAIAKDGTLYAGTGETNPGGGSLTYFGSGVYRSDDRGKTWIPIGLKRSFRIGRIAIDPNDPDHVFVGVSGNLFRPGGMRGLYETTDRGASWKLVLEGDTDTTGVADVVMSEDAKTIFVAMWDHIRYPDWRDYAGPGSAVYRSQDGGKSFERLGPSNGLPPSTENTGRIGVGIDPQDPQRVYAIYVNDLGAFQHFFISINGGDAWVQPPGSVTLTHSQSVYGWWFGRIWVDPKDSNHVFVAGLPLMESFDGGQSFPVTQLDQHVDHHAMAWDPHVDDRVYNGNDGGVYRSDVNGADGSWKHGKYQPWVQFYTIDVSEQDPSRINGGLQDQGSVRSWSGRDGWDHYYGGDGIKNAINPKDKQNVFACFQYGGCARSDDGGDTMQSMDNESSRYGWLTPIEFQPDNTDVMYWAGNRVNRSEDRGRSWHAISPDLGKGELGREQNPLYAGHYGTVQAIGLNQADPKTIYAGTDNGYLWKTTDVGETWTEIDDEALPDRWITHITVKPRNPDVVYVTFSGYRQGDNEAYVLRTKDGGKSWTDVSGNLPKAPVNDLITIGRRIFVATDVGVFTRRVGSERWLKLGRGLPRVPVNDLRYTAKNDTIYAGTFGHGVYAVPAP